MSNIQTGAERLPHDLSHLGFLAGQIGRFISFSTTQVIAGDSFELDAVGALRLSPLRRGLAIASTVAIFTFYVLRRHFYGAQWVKFMKDGVIATLERIPRDSQLRSKIEIGLFHPISETREQGINFRNSRQIAVGPPGVTVIAKANAQREVGLDFPIVTQI